MTSLGRRFRATAAVVAVGVAAVACGSTQPKEAAGPTSAGSATSSSGTSSSGTSSSGTSSSGTSSSGTSSSGTSSTGTSSTGTSSTATSTTEALSTETEQAAATTTVALTVLAGNGGGSFSVPHTLSVPRGWTAEVWARVPDARMEAWSPQGDLLVSQPTDGQVIELVPGANGQTRPTERTVLSGLTQPQGLAFAKVGGAWVLYVGESDQIDRYAWVSGGVGQRTVVAGNLPDQDPSGDDVHRTKDVAVAANGTVYFDVGSSSNANPDDRTASPPRGVIMAVNGDGTDLRVVEKGVRNGEGLAVAPDGTVWTAVNNRDNVTYPFTGSYGGVANAFGRVIQAYVNEHPPDEVVPVTPERDLGWPYCNPDPDRATPAGSEMDLPLIPDAVTNRDDTFDCAALPHIELGLAAHSAPLGLSFLEGSHVPAPWSAGAVLAVHGSWDRQPPRAPGVVWMAWDPTAKTLRTAVTLVGGFQETDGSRWGRPVDAVAGPDGDLYVSDDAAGAVYRLAPPGT